MALMLIYLCKRSKRHIPERHFQEKISLKIQNFFQPKDLKLSLIVHSYHSSCPDCLQRYVGKTDLCFHIRMDEHGTRSVQDLLCIDT